MVAQAFITGAGKFLFAVLDIVLRYWWRLCIRGGGRCLCIGRLRYGEGNSKCALEFLLVQECGKVCQFLITQPGRLVQLLALLELGLEAVTGVEQNL